ncbi:hypothetical protein EJ08DRAFT_647220 [Tothia fuscella]|uniref:Uncharacterized protein n=1 Tax=Tothia fuscella TaxID=1048955 RepID=A0A9P4NY71_9PEZI|nr:hypothetical protein EJ08DRAFT_647220 [Tothia fuscella]
MRPSQLSPRQPSPTRWDRRGHQDLSKEAEYDERARVSTFGRWHSKRTPDLRTIQYANDQEELLRQRQEAEPSPALPSPRITSFLSEQEHKRLEEQRINPQIDLPEEQTEPITSYFDLTRRQSTGRRSRGSLSTTLKIRRPFLGRFSSGEYSPSDTSDKALDNPAFNEMNDNIVKQLPPQAPAKPEPTFLPSEAKRVNTPPPIKTSKVKGNRITGYFLDLWSNEDDNKSVKSRDSPDKTDYHTPFPLPKVSTITDSNAHPGKEKDWYRIRMDRIMGGDEPRDVAGLDWDIPEHLPTSPLCPLHTKYRGRGKRICVYHGRRSDPNIFTDLGIDAWS